MTLRTEPNSTQPASDQTQSNPVSNTKMQIFTSYTHNSVTDTTEYSTLPIRDCRGIRAGLSHVHIRPHHIGGPTTRYE